MSMGGNNALYIVQIILSYANIIVTTLFPIVGIYFLLGPGGKLVKATIAYLNEQTASKQSVCTTESTLASSAEEENKNEE
ncbi:hypothetical protein CS063_05565 [Sporanaerobium hydrogeniformans]|uniref:Uncharacterized protein n=1 Tax=Sporanaerobium hydrogeniformans TaxID=3072179 RepID=A0AC61DF36_9FIRM|nr:hypothetical protein [Sporanaerobium hydrogeniformans]PHV71515.1 hypothetical protein CS063_05565 [Sporanaerobium hydrogeniformans]